MKRQCTQVRAELKKSARDAEAFKTSKSENRYARGKVFYKLELEPTGRWRWGHLRKAVIIEEGKHCQNCDKAQWEQK